MRLYFLLFKGGVGFSLKKTGFLQFSRSKLSFFEKIFLTFTYFNTGYTIKAKKTGSFGTMYGVFWRVEK